MPRDSPRLACAPVGRPEGRSGGQARTRLMTAPARPGDRPTPRALAAVALPCALVS
ncbi:hypothetical protein GTY88_35320, partial [Streptomyces sp. SID5926]|nr:hypothetical protein [Streptomyces sp. SID5926]